MKRDTYFMTIMKRFLRHKLAVVGIVIVLLLVLLSIFADIIAPTPNIMNLDAALIPPMQEVHCARSKGKIAQSRYLYVTGPANQAILTSSVVTAKGEVQAEFENIGVAIEVLSADGQKRFVPSSFGSMSPTDKVIGESNEFATFRTKKSYKVMEYLYHFKVVGEHTKPTREVIEGDFLDVEWEDMGVAYLVVDTSTDQRRLHYKNAPDLKSTETEIGPLPKPLLGTDTTGRDMAQRLVQGARISLYVGIVVELISLLIGIPIGAIAGYFGGRIDNWFMRFTDIMFAFPGLLFAIAVMSIFEERSIITVFIALGLVWWPQIARIIRGQYISLKEYEFVEGAKAIGCSNFRIMTKHLLPNTLAPIIVYSTLGIASAIMSEAGLSFLGIGIRPPTPSWGTMINEGFQHALDAPHVWLIPGIVIAIVVLAFNFLGDGLRDALDPKLKI